MLLQQKGDLSPNLGKNYQWKAGKQAKDWGADRDWLVRGWGWERRKQEKERSLPKELMPPLPC